MIASSPAAMMMVRTKFAVALLFLVICCNRSSSFEVEPLHNESSLQESLPSDVVETTASSISNETYRFTRRQRRRGGGILVLRDWLRNIKYGALCVIRNSIMGLMERRDLFAHERNIMKVYKQALPSVASIKVYVENIEHNHTQDELKEDGIFLSVSGGSGFLWDDQGHIVTNHHVLFDEGDQEPVVVRVKFSGMFDFLDVDIVGSEPKRDIAVLKVSSDDAVTTRLPRPIKKGSSRYLQVGQTCLAIGSPHSRPDSLTIGVISGLNRDIGSNKDVYVPGNVQTDGMYLPEYLSFQVAFLRLVPPQEFSSFQN